MSRLTRLILFAVCALLFFAAPAGATDASDAYKKAKALAKKVNVAATEAERTEAQEILGAFVRQAVSSLSAKDLSKMDTAHLGRIQGLGGLYKEAAATLKKAVDHPGATRYPSGIYLMYTRALIDAEEYDKAYAAYEYMAKEYETEKNLKIAAMSVGMALRSQRMWNKSAKALHTSLKMKNSVALKPLVNSLLLDGQKEIAIKNIEWAIETAGEFGKEEAHEILLNITKKHGEVIELDFDAFAPELPPDLEGKVVVMGAWNVSAGSLRWTMETLQSIFDQFPPVQGVVTLALTTYYKKDPDTGMMVDMSPEAEREIGLSFREQHKFEGSLAYTKDRAGLHALGVSALPHIVIVDKDRKLLYSHTINRHDPTEIEVVREIIMKAIK